MCVSAHVGECVSAWVFVSGWVSLLWMDVVGVWLWCTATHPVCGHLTFHDCVTAPLNLFGPVCDDAGLDYRRLDTGCGHGLALQLMCVTDVFLNTQLTLTGNK